MEVELSPLDSPAHDDPAAALADRELIDAALAKLDPDHRAVVALHQLDCSVGSIASWQRVAP